MVSGPWGRSSGWISMIPFLSLMLLLNLTR